MGVDITAYEHVTPVDYQEVNSLRDKWGEIDAPDIRQFWQPDFKDRSDGLEEGWYRVAGESISDSYSYGGYNDYRKRICVAVHGFEPETLWHGGPAMEPLALYRWINFSDCEGFLGPQTCRVLADQAAITPIHFAVDEPRIGTKTTAEKWETWKQMFELAADTGAIRYS